MRTLPSFLLALCLSACTLIAGVPGRVVSQTVGTDDLLMVLAEPGQIAALSHLARDARYSPGASEAAAYPCLRNGEAEDILRFKPDLVLVASYTQAETIRLLERAHVPLMKVDHFETLADLYANTRRLGVLLNRSQKAEALVAQWQRRVEDLDRRLKGVKPVRVVSVGFYPFTAGSGTTFQDLCDHAGGLNVATEAGLVGHAPTPNEKMLTWNIDVLVAPGEAGLDVKGKLSGMAPYKYLKAFKQGHLVVLPGTLLSATSHRRLDGYEALARALHPERFQ